jgi:D-arabinose 1-dehydrogenase-like Zn-dependent alcohol dehydrogenase
MYGYNEPLRIDEVPVPGPGPEEILLKVAACGMCRSDYQLQVGYFKGPFPVEFPYIPGHEVTGRVAGLGSSVPGSVGYSEGDTVVVNPSWGDGTCRQCRKKLRDTGKLLPGRTLAVTGIGGLGSYGVQYAKLLGGGATVVAFGRADNKLVVAKENGADLGINVRDKSTEAIQDELERMTGRRAVDAILDCVGSQASISMGFDLLGPEGVLTAVGLMSDRVEHRQFPFVGMELSYLGSFWGNHLDLVEVLSLAEAGLVKHNVTKVRLEDVNQNLESLGRGDVVGRQVIVFS